MSLAKQANWFKRSLLLRLGMAMAAIILFAVIGMLSSVIIAETARGYAAAINQAGTLRMQSYRIASSLVHSVADKPLAAIHITRQLVEEFNQRLFSQRIHGVLEKYPSQQVLLTYALVERQWQERIQPQLMEYLGQAEQPIGVTNRHQAVALGSAEYLRNVDSFVEDIHRFVKALELDAERKNQQLRVIQIISLLLVFVVASVSMYLAKTNVLRPLKDLLACANSARQGDFSARSHYLGEDELGQLAHGFNVMAEDLSKLYADLEARVQAKTADLERSNRSLELLYRISKHLSDASLEEDGLGDVIQDIERLLRIGNACICLGQPGEEPTQYPVLTHADDGDRRHRCNRYCQQWLNRSITSGVQIWPEESGDIRVFCVPIRDKSTQFGVLMVELHPAMSLEAWQQILLETVAQHIAMSINAAQQAAKSRMLSLLEERSVIARELHDSLAQSLSYLKIQVSRLEKKVRERAPQSEVLTVSQVLRTGLNGAYRQLRELLTTFRLRINEADLGAAVATTVHEFAQRGDISIEFHNHLVNCRLQPNAEIHVIQIVREALSNVIRHANATLARVELDCDASGTVTVLIEDDGSGLQEQTDMLHHYGMPIMRERAEWLGGNLQVSEPEGGGTRVRLTFSLTDGEHRENQHSRLQKLSDG